MQVTDSTRRIPQAIGSQASIVSAEQFLTTGDKAGALSPRNPIKMFGSGDVTFHFPFGQTARYTPSQLYHLMGSVSAGVDPDVDRYDDILKGKAREKLKKFISPEEMIGRKGDNIVSIPVPSINLPRFRRGEGDGQGGVGSGDGEIGQPVARGEDGDEPSEAGGDKGTHINEEYIPMSRSEIAKLLIKDLGLPNLQPKGENKLKEEGIKWTTYSQSGNDWNRRLSAFNALQRTAVEIGDQFDLDNPDDLSRFLDSVVIEEKDKVYNSWTISQKPHANAVIFYMMDVSGSMTDDQKKIVRTAAWYLSTIIQQQFGEIRAELRGETFSEEHYGEGVEEVFIIHDAGAKEVSEYDFYTTRESGGTRISSAYKLAEDIIKQRYNPETWNIYLFHFSDGDNWGEDNRAATEVLDRLNPQINEFGYIQTESPYGSGEWKEALESKYGEEDRKIRISEISAEGSDKEFRQAMIDMLGERK